MIPITRETYTLGLDHAVNEGAGKASKQLFGLLMRLRLAVALAVVLVRLCGLYSRMR